MVTANHTGIYWNTIFLMTPLLEHRALEGGSQGQFCFLKCTSIYDIFLESLGQRSTQEVFKDVLIPSEGSGRSRRTKNWGFG